MTNPVAPVVTDKMVDIAEIAYDNEADLTNTDYENRHFCYRGPLRAAITAALEASGELERLRAALNNIRALAAKRQHEGGPDGNFKAIEEFANYGLNKTDT